VAVLTIGCLYLLALSVGACLTGCYPHNPPLGCSFLLLDCDPALTTVKSVLVPIFLLLKRVLLAGLSLALPDLFLGVFVAAFSIAAFLFLYFYSAFKKHDRWLMLAAEAICAGQAVALTVLGFAGENLDLKKAVSYIFLGLALILPLLYFVICTLKLLHHFKAD
jgi:hypothetical protein